MSLWVIMTLWCHCDVIMMSQLFCTSRCQALDFAKLVKMCSNYLSLVMYSTVWSVFIITKVTLYLGMRMRYETGNRAIVISMKTAFKRCPKMFFIVGLIFAQNRTRPLFFMILGQNSTYSKMDIIWMLHSCWSQWYKSQLYISFLAQDTYQSTYKVLNIILV